MKRILIAISVMIITLFACSEQKSNQENDCHGTHQHDDGMVHQNHENDSVKQEEFTVPADTSNGNTEQSKEHTHEGDDRPHKH